MSGLAEVSGLLQGLASGAVTLAQARDIAARAQQRFASGTAGTGSTARSAPTEADAGKQIDKLNAIKFGQDQGLLTPQQAGDAAEGVVGGTMLASADGGVVAPNAVDGRPPEPGILAEVQSRPRLKECYDVLVTRGWEIRLTNVAPGNVAVDEARRLLMIDDLNVSYTTSANWVEQAVRRAFQLDDDLRLSCIRDKGAAIWVSVGLTDLEKMAQLYDWAVWFWQYPAPAGDADGLLGDMMLTLTDRTPSGMSTNDGRFRILPATFAKSTGFKRTYRDDSNQVRHATASIKASYDWGAGGLELMQSREDPKSADFRLNEACNRIAQMIGRGGTRVPSDLASILRTELGDPSETGPWTGPAEGEPPSP
jgi:hypothetical protein